MPRNELRALNLPIADELAKRSGSKPRVRPLECQPYAVAGIIPKLVFSPRSLGEASKIVATIASEGAAIVIRGAGTKQWRPPHPYEVDVVLDATRCSGVIDHTPADLTVTVATGTTFAELQDVLRAHGQFFPNDPPFAAETSVGGMLSAGLSGALRQRYGGLRDNVLGMRVCLSDGSIAFTGSRVVKSVAGYDIPKLFVGARGTLGFIGQVTLKVAPLPREQCGVVGSFARAEDASDAAQRLASSPLFPMATTLHDHAAARHVRALGGQTSEWTLVVRCGGSRSSVSRQVDEVSSVLRASGASTLDVLDADRLHFAWSDIAELAGGEIYPGSQHLIFAVACLPTQVPAVLSAVSETFPQAQCTAHPASGVVYAHVAADSVPRDPFAGQLERLCAQERWMLRVLAAPQSFGSNVRAPLPADAPVALWRSVKASLDPSGTFDPGRFLAGI